MDLLIHLRDLYGQESIGLDDVHDKVFTFVKDRFLSGKPLQPGCVPPIEIIIEATQNFLSSENSITGSIPDFLDLVSAVECYRLTANDRAAMATEWHEYYVAQEDSSSVPLTNKDIALLKKVESQAMYMRKIYIKILCSYCAVDLYKLWMGESSSIADYMIRYNEYFPFITSIKSFQSPRLFLQDLHPDDLELLRSMGTECSALVERTVLWAENRIVSGQKFTEIFQTEDFRNQFPCPYEESRLVSLAFYYLQNVKKMIEELQAIFTPNKV